MAPSEVLAYLPPLDKCLDGTRQILSWRLAFAALDDDSPTVGNRALRRFLLSADTIEVLARSLDPCSKPSAKSRSDFDTHTAAINIAPNGNGKYDASQIKGDALWLSGRVELDEVSALRLVVLEWQTRTSVRLLQGLAHEEIPGLGASSKLKSSLLASISRQSTRKLLNADGDFESERARRLRLLETYLSETQFQYKTLEHIIFRTLCESSPSTPANFSEDAMAASDKEYLIHRAGHLILNAWNVDGVRSASNKNWLVDAAAFISLKLKSMESGSRLFLEEGGIEELEISWCKTRALEIIHIMHTILIVVQNSQKMARSDGFLSWFQSMDEIEFFGFFELPFPTLDAVYPYHLRSLATLVSLSLIKIQTTLELLPEIALVSSMGEADGKTPYVKNVQCVAEVTQILFGAASHASSPVQPVALAWSIILQDARGYANSSQEARDLRQSQKAIDSIAPAQQSDTESNDSSSSRQRPTSYRRTSFGSDTSQQQTFLEEVVDGVSKVDRNEDVISLLARSAFHGLGAFNTMTDLALQFCTSFGSECNGKPGLKMRLILLSLLKAALDYVEYQPDLVQTTLAITLGGSLHWETRGPLPDYQDSDPASVFFNDQSLMDRIYGAAVTRFPYETLPYLKLCQALAYAQSSGEGEKQPIASRLELLQTLTSVLYEDETSYELVDEAGFFIKLVSPLDVMATLERGKVMRQQTIQGTSANIMQSQAFVLPEGTAGRSMTDVKPLVVLFRFEYSGLKYMGLMLQRTLTLRSTAHPGLADSIFETALGVLELLTTLLRAAFPYSTDQASNAECQTIAQSILEEASDGLDRNFDIVSLILSIFEDELYQDRLGSSREPASELLVHCMQFTHALLAILPGRVWSFLGRSGMLGMDGLESRLANVIAMVEVSSGHFPLLTSAVHLFEALVEDVVVHAISRKSVSGAITRHGSSISNLSSAGVTEAAMKKILLHFCRVMVDALESCGNWRFGSIEERLDINTTICRTFDSILAYCFDIDDDQDLSQKITSPLAPTAEYLLDVFLSQVTNDLPLQPLLQTIQEGVSTPISTLSVKGTRDWVLQTESALRLTCRLVRTNTYLGRPPCRLEEQLFAATPVLAKVFTAHHSYRLPVLELLDALVRGAGSAHGQPPSLLAHLGQGTAKCFLDLLSNLDEPLDNLDLSIATWKFLSAIVSQRQQWFAIYILTGDTPKNSLKARKSCRETASQVRPMLDVAIKKLCHLERLQPVEAVNMLEFIALSMDFWPWVCEEVRGNNDVIKSFTLLLTNLKAPALGSGSKAAPEFQPQGIQMAAFVSNILAMIINRCNEVEDDSFAKRIAPHLNWLIKYGVSAPIYNSSLHASLRKNFEASPILGENFYYDIEMASKVLQHDSSWKAKGGQGFFDEFERANINYSFVEAQVNLFHSWKSLAVEMSIALSGETSMQNSMVEVVRNSLRCNLENTLPELIFSKLAQSRANLAFVLLQRLIDTSKGNPNALSVLKDAWETLRTNAPDLGAGLTGPEADYNRTLLKILYLALQAHASGPSGDDNTGDQSTPTKKASAETASLVLEVIGHCVSRGFRSLVTYLHDDVNKVLPDDIALINAILRTSLRIPNVDRSTEQLVTYFAEDNTARYASTLLSWADRLAVDSDRNQDHGGGNNNDPVYGELSIMFLVEMSSVPALAEHIVTSGSLAQVGSTNLMQYFRRPGGTGPFDSPARMYRIWTRGLLPLALNVLGAIGAPIVGDVSAFLNQFAAQLDRASASLDPKPAPAPTPSASILLQQQAQRLPHAPHHHAASHTHALAPAAGYLTLGMASETHSLALLSAIIEMFRAAGAGAGITPAEVAPLRWDRGAVKADLESRLQRRNALRDDVVPCGEREEGWARMRPVGGGDDGTAGGTGPESRLEEKVVAELKAALAMMADVE